MLQSDEIQSSPRNMLPEGIAWSSPTGVENAWNAWEVPFAFHTGPGCSDTSNREPDGKFYVAQSFAKSAGAYGLPYHAIKWVVLDVALSD
ncbi:MAG: hypothetical protein V1800_16820 [Candidatus Latescibacterota bacterium]